MDVTQTPEIVVLIYAGTEVEDLHDILAEPEGMMKLLGRCMSSQIESTFFTKTVQ